MKKTAAILQEAGKMKIGIALGGGGAKGLAHIGVIKVLEEHGILPQLVSGTSIGALIGALYLLRGSIHAVEAYALGFENSKLSPYLSPRPSSSGLISEKRIQNFLHELFGSKRIEDLDRPFFCPAVDIRRGQEVMFARGSLQRAVRASISVPVIFKPVRLHRSYLVDGGLINPVPVDVLKKNGADFTIAVNVITQRPLRPRRRKTASTREKLLLARLDDFLNRRLISGRPDEEPNLIESFLSTMEIMQQKLIAARLQNDAPDVTIHIDTQDFKLFEFYRPGAIIRRGEETARREIKAVLSRWQQRLAENKTKN
jgi:NTE family protein